MSGVVFGVIGAIVGIVGLVASLVSIVKNNAKWNGIVEEKMNRVIESLGKVENRLAKLEDDRAAVWKEIAEIRSIQIAHEKSIDRLHIRLDRIKGGRDKELDAL